jgi:hypothetical protein
MGIKYTEISAEGGRPAGALVPGAYYNPHTGVTHNSFTETTASVHISRQSRSFSIAVRAVGYHLEPRYGIVDHFGSQQHFEIWHRVTAIESKFLPKLPE